MRGIKLKIVLAICKRPKTIKEIAKFLESTNNSCYVLIDDLVKRNYLISQKVKGINYYSTTQGYYPAVADFLIDFREMVK